MACDSVLVLLTCHLPGLWSGFSEPPGFRLFHVLPALLRLVLGALMLGALSAMTFSSGRAVGL